MLSKALTLLTLGAAAQAAQGPWQQCGGTNYQGGTSCQSGLYCSSVNPYYYQCVSGTGAAATSAQAPAPAPAASTTPAATVGSGQTTLATSGVAAATSAPANTAGAPGNPFSGNQMYANPYYASEVLSLAVPSLPASLQAAASGVAKVPTFMWLDVAAKIPLVGTYLGNIKTMNAGGASPPVIGAFVVYDLPDRDCAALASNGEYSIANGGVANYKAYIDGIRAQILKYPDVNVVLVIEPDSLANLVTNLSVTKCANAASAYKECITYAIQQLNLPNVSMYLDAGHGGWLGWSANIGPAADLFGSLYKAAGSPSRVRGLATNVANYNAWTIDVCPSYTTPNTNCDEKRYINALAPLLTAQGFPAHFITDTGRSGKQPTGQIQQGDWCNQIGTGFGLRPGAATGDPLLDSFVWVKPGGECDGTSNTTSPRYDAHCGLADALKPAPEAGQWFEAYFQQLLVNANPSFT